MQLSKHPLSGWIVFTGILITEILVDYLFRMADSNIHTGGLNESFWMEVQVLAGIIGLFFVYRSAKEAPTWQKKCRLLTVNIVSGLAAYILLAYSYILGLGLDSF